PGPYAPLFRSVITKLAIGYFAPDQPGLGLQVAKALEVFAIVLGPVAIGMILRRVRPGFADAMDRPVRIGSVVILAVVIAGAVAANFELLRAPISSLATITVLFCIMSLLVGYFVPRSFGVKDAQSLACSFEIGIHNATLAIVLAQTVIGNMEMSLPAAVYGVLMFFIALGFGFLLPRRNPAETVPHATGATPA